MRLYTHTHTLIFTLIGIIILVIVAGIIIVNKTNIIDEVQARISNFSTDNEELADESVENESSEESIVDTSIEDGYYDEENKVTWHVEEDGSMCPIPDGYIGSEATGEDGISTGYVIYEGTAAVTDENVEEAKTTRNQYVWIPVTDASQMYGIDSNGKKWGKLYNFATSSSDANYDEETGTYPVNWSENNGIITPSSTIREPDVVKELDTDSRLITLGIGAETTHEFLIQLEQEFNAMIESVEKYGGFYIGRYETGNLSKEKALVVQGNTDINWTTWYNSYKLCKTLSGNNENVETGLIWGCQWDRTLIWFIESGNKTVEEICDSNGWGNYYDTTFQYTNSNGNTVVKVKNTNTIIPTGSTEYTNTNNIYDLAGNIYEWTVEANTNIYRMVRGGGVSQSASSTPAVSYRYIQGYLTTTNSSMIRL